MLKSLKLSNQGDNLFQVYEFWSRKTVYSISSAIFNFNYMFLLKPLSPGIESDWEKEDIDSKGRSIQGNDHGHSFTGRCWVFLEGEWLGTHRSLRCLPQAKMGTSLSRLDWPRETNFSDFSSQKKDVMGRTYRVIRQDCHSAKYVK